MDTALAARRAVETESALLALRNARSGLYREPGATGLRRALGTSRLAACSLWPYANAWRSLQGVVALPGAGAGSRPAQWAALLPDHVDALAAYAAGGRREVGTEVGQGDGDRAGTSKGGGALRLEAGTSRPPGGRGDAYYDDNDWIALALFAQHRLTGERRCLSLALRVLDFVLSGWSEEPGWASPGGIRWAEPAWSRSRNTCANGPGAQAAALAHRATGEERFLRWSERIVDWTDATLRDGRGLYVDRIDPDGTLHQELWSYNQGTMIGAHVLLHEQTGEERHLELATETARAARAWLDAPGALGGQPAEFLAIYLRNVSLLTPYADVSANLAQVAGRAATAWERERTPDGLFSLDKTQVNRTAGMAAIYALLAGSTPLP